MYVLIEFKDGRIVELNNVKRERVRADGATLKYVNNYTGDVFRCEREDVLFHIVANDYKVVMGPRGLGTLYPSGKAEDFVDSHGGVYKICNDPWEVNKIRKTRLTS